MFCRTEVMTAGAGFVCAFRRIYVCPRGAGLASASFSCSVRASDV